jgi:hypothetical protein
MSLTKNGADSHVKGASSIFLVCESNPDPAKRLSIPNVMRVKGYSKDKAVNCTLKMQVRQEVKKLKGNASTSAPAVLSTAATMVVFSTMVLTTVLATIMPGDKDGLLMLSLSPPPKKTINQATSNKTK